ncbi:ion transporter [Bacteroidia bacterium]|jgi:voltage-gated potassium channel|nr:ion transporter [Bacteroidia bacterium]
MAKYPSIHERIDLSYKEKWHVIIFEADTQEGRRFDIWLLWVILFSILTLMADSVPSIHADYFLELKYAEYFFTAVFTLEYFARLLVSRHTKRYVFSFWGVIDLVSTIPTYLTFFFPASPLFRVIRTIRLLRIFKVLRLTRFMGEAQGMGSAIRRSGAKITVFFGVVLVIVVVMGTLMYVIEPEEAGFTSIPRSIYWAVVTLTTVGYGDIAPVTALGQFLSAALMILGYAVIAVPTGIVSVELSQTNGKLVCYDCNHIETDTTSNYCKKCGAHLKK